MDEKKIFGGLGIVAVILLLAVLFVPRDRGPDVKDLIADEIAPVSDAVAALGDRVAAVEGSLGDLSEQVAAADSSEALAALSARVDETAAQTSSLGDELSAVETALEDTNATVAEAVAAAAAAVVSTAAAPAAGETIATEDASAADADGAPGMMPGETAVFSDGQLRLFISRLDPAAKEVRVSHQGDMIALATGTGRTFAVGKDYCRVTVSGVSSNGALMDAVCGDDLPAPEGIGVGQTALFEDGALRVFASLVDADKARLAVNGDLHMLAIGRSIPVAAGEQDCRVYLDAVDRGHASVSAQCGDAVTVSDVAGPGSTVLLDDGALRVFVGSVAEDSVRFSVNGQTLVSGASGDRHSVGDGCDVIVEDIMDGKASFSLACDS